MRRWPLLLGIAVTGLIGCRPEKPAAAENPVRWIVTEADGSLRPGSVINVRLAAMIDSGWYVYSLTQKPGGPTPTRISVMPSPPFRVEGNALGPKPVVIFDKEFGIETERYEGKPDFAIRVVVEPTADPRPHTLAVAVRYQACNASFCLPARTTVIQTLIRIAGPSRTASLK